MRIRSFILGPAFAAALLVPAQAQTIPTGELGELGLILDPASTSDAVFIEQVGRTATARGVDFIVTQLGSGNFASIEQGGEAAGIANFALQVQVGNDNTSAITQDGSGNLASTAQYGNSNAAAITQFGAGNLAISTQVGNANTIEINQYGGESLVVTQTGNNAPPIVLTQY